MTTSPVPNLTFWLVLVLLIPLASQTCYLTCKSCVSQTPYSCSSCKDQQQFEKIEQYLWSCQIFTRNDGFYIFLCVFIVLLEFFVLAMGIGVYQSIYSYVQLTSILLWVQVDGNRIYALQGTNFALLHNNNFTKTYGIQFVFLLFIITIFSLLVLSIQKIPHNPTAILLRRKRVIFPIRIIFLFYNMLFFVSITSLSQITQNFSSTDIFEIFITILAVGSCILAYMFVFYICNCKEFKFDDPHYYVIVEKLASGRWWVRNKLAIELTGTTLVIICFVFGFRVPSQMLIVLIIFQTFNIAYMFFLISWIKIRYKIFNILGNCLFFGTLICLKGLTDSTTVANPRPDATYSIIYTILVTFLACLFCIATISQILSERYTIMRQLRSIKSRFIMCQRIQKQVEMSRYDQHSHRKKVTEFFDNQIYGCDLSGVRKKLIMFKDDETTSKN